MPNADDGSLTTNSDAAMPHDKCANLRSLAEEARAERTRYADMVAQREAKIEDLQAELVKMKERMVEAEAWAVREVWRIHELEEEKYEYKKKLAALEAELARLRDERQETQRVLAMSGIRGIYDNFQGIANAIGQMALYIRERDKRIVELYAELAALRAAKGEW